MWTFFSMRNIWRNAGTLLVLLAVYCTTFFVTIKLYLQEFLPNWAMYIKTKELIWNICVIYLSVPLHSPGKISSFVTYFILLSLLSKTEVLESEWRPYGTCIKIKLSLPLKNKVRFLLMHSSFVNLILCSLLTGNITL
jgi:hypothetical protein